MSMKKFTKKMLAIVAAAAMTMGLAMPAFASETGTGERPKVTDAYISKTFNTEVNTGVVNGLKFKFTATQVKKGEGVNTTDHRITIPDIAFATPSIGSNKAVSKIDFGDPFTEVGEYVYEVKENEQSDPVVAETDHEKLIMSKAEYTMHVYVAEDKGTFKIDNIIVNNKKDDKGVESTAKGKVDNIGGNANDNTFRFVNTYVQEAGTGTDPTKPGKDYTDFGSLNVSKKVVNLYTKAAQSFNFTASFVFPEGTDATTLKNGVKANGTDITNNLNSGYTFKLEDGKNMKFTGLPVGTEITVTEAATQNYKGSAVVTINGTEEDIAADGYNKDLSISKKKLGQNKNAVDVTNTYNNVPTTGIIMNTLPYVLMVALCGVALIAFVASKRRKVQK